VMRGGPTNCLKPICAAPDVTEWLVNKFFDGIRSGIQQPKITMKQLKEAFPGWYDAEVERVGLEEKRLEGYVKSLMSRKALAQKVAAAELSLAQKQREVEAAEGNMEVD
jgi:hypothetical protein